MLCMLWYCSIMHVVSAMCFVCVMFVVPVEILWHYACCECHMFYMCCVCCTCRHVVHMLLHVMILCMLWYILVNIFHLFSRYKWYNCFYLNSGQTTRACCATNTEGEPLTTNNEILFRVLSEKSGYFVRKKYEKTSK